MVGGWRLGDKLEAQVTDTVNPLWLDARVRKLCVHTNQLYVDFIERPRRASEWIAVHSGRLWRLGDKSGPSHGSQAEHAANAFSYPSAAQEQAQKLVQRQCSCHS